jgi:thymidine kinase
MRVNSLTQLVASDIEVARKRLIEGKTVIVSGLDMTYRCEPFGVIPHLMAIADRVQKLTLRFAMFAARMLGTRSGS